MKTEIVGVVQRSPTAEAPHGWLGFAEEVDGFQGYTFTGLTTRGIRDLTNLWGANLERAGMGTWSAVSRMATAQLHGLGRDEGALILLVLTWRAVR